MIMRVRRQVMADRLPALPAAPGAYVLVLSLVSPRRLAAGALGTFDFPPGAYVYCGSALGPGGIRARAGRHLERRGPAHWHIDYLLRRARVCEIRVREEPRRLECLWAAALAASDLCERPVPRFGASDCRCPAHLWRVKRSLEDLEAVLLSLPAPPLPVWP